LKQNTRELVGVSGYSGNLHRLKVLVVDDDPMILKMVKTVLENSSLGFEVLTTGSGREGVEMAKSDIPDLILLDLMMPEMDGIEVCEMLRASRLTYLIPIIMLTASASSIHRLDALRTGVDEYLSKPFDPEELEARIIGLIRRFRLTRASNPLTGLPGNLAIEQEINRRLTREDERFACCYFDLDNFKAYNDYYGFEKGDECIRWVAQLLIEVSEELGRDDDFVGHVGGDDFIYITSPDNFESICQTVCDRFDSQVGRLYNDVDRNQGYIEVTNRREEMQRFPLMAMSVGVATNKHRSLSSPLQVAEIASELKRAAKARHTTGSHFIVDRRTS
jgi:diguanylate cyclase (GGDEF)-like protein